MVDESLRHPAALYILSLTELWERFGFYVVQGLLVLYLTEYYGFTDDASYTLLGTFTGLVYLAPLIGGYIANHIFGFKDSILWGGFFLVVGYAFLAFVTDINFIYPALATIIVGNGMFKPNISGLLGTQYHEDDPRRDAGFTIFYIGINIGALLAALSAGYVKQYFGWQYCFGSASVGLIIGLASFLYGFKKFQDIKRDTTTKRFKIQFFIGAILAIIALSFVMQFSVLSTWLLPLIGVGILIYLATLIVEYKNNERKNLVILTILLFGSVVFWALFFQLFSSANLYVERLVDKDFFGVTLTSSIFWGSESIFIILLGPFFAWLWKTIESKHYNPSPISKFALGIAFAGLGFSVLAVSTIFPNSLGFINPTWIFLAYLLITIGELLLSPIGLSAITTLAPSHLIGVMMGVWFVSTGFGGKLSGIIAQLASLPDNTVSDSEKLVIYQQAFLDYTYLAFAIAILLMFIHILLRQWLHHRT